MSRNEFGLLFFAIILGVALAFSRIMKAKYPERSDMWLVDLFVGLLVATVLSFPFPELIHWTHFTIADYNDPGRH